MLGNNYQKICAIVFIPNFIPSVIVNQYIEVNVVPFISILKKHECLRFNTFVNIDQRMGNKHVIVHISTELSSIVILMPEMCYWKNIWRNTFLVRATVLILPKSWGNRTAIQRDDIKWVGDQEILSIPANLTTNHGVDLGLLVRAGYHCMWWSRETF